MIITDMPDEKVLSRRSFRSTKKLVKNSTRIEKTIGCKSTKLSKRLKVIKMRVRS